MHRKTPLGNLDFLDPKENKAKWGEDFLNNLREVSLGSGKYYVL